MAEFSPDLLWDLLLLRKQAWKVGAPAEGTLYRLTQNATAHGDSLVLITAVREEKQQKRKNLWTKKKFGVHNKSSRKLEIVVIVRPTLATSKFSQINELMKVTDFLFSPGKINFKMFLLCFT